MYGAFVIVAIHRKDFDQIFSLGKETESVSATLSGRILWPRRNEVTGE